MPGHGDQLKGALSEGVSDALLRALDVDRLATELRHPPVREALLEGVLGERSVGVEISDDVAPISHALHRLDVPRFGADLVGQFDGRCNGYVVRVLVPGGSG